MLVVFHVWGLKKGNTLPVSPLKLAAGAGAAVFSMLIGSFFGDSGTLIGAATGSLAYGVAAEGLEYSGKKAHAKARAAAKAARRPPTTPGTLRARVEARPGGQEAMAQAEVRREMRLLHVRPWMLAGSGLALAAASTGTALVVMSATEAATGKTFHGALTDTRDYGSTFAHSTAPPSPAPTPAPSDESPSPSPSETLTTVPTLSPTMGPSPTLIPTVVPSPTTTVVPVTPSPSHPAGPPPAATLTP